MITLAETADAARELSVSERRLRRLVERGEVAPTAKTRRGTLLFDENDLARAKHELQIAGQKQ